jgi:dipeptidyl aminopeptidase/acylaminoacyl peptidase
MKNIWLLTLFFALLSLGSLNTSAQEGPEPKEGALGTFMNKEPNDINGQFNLLQTNVYKLQVDTTVLLFIQQYGSRVHLERVFYPANTNDHEFVPAYLFTPANLPKGEKRPGLVIVHGALHESLDWRFFRLIEAAVAHGYAVIFPEFHGSVGYGEGIYQNSYGHTDVADVLASADFLAKQDYVDPTRMGILGHSRGGYVTVMAIEKAPKRFQAAVEICALLDFVAYMSYKPDERRAEIAREKEFGGKLPSQNLPPYLEISPLNNVEAIQTPLLALATTGDRIVPVSLNTVRLAELLKAHDKVFESHVYTNAPGGHNYFMGESDEQRDTFKRSFDWLGKYLKP